MKILLQNTKTGRFLEQSDRWTKTFEAAQDFGSTEKALKFATTHKLSQVQVVAAFPSARYVDLVGYPTPLPASVASVRRARAVLKTWNTLPAAA
jgi:hypothetical protein